MNKHTGRRPGAGNMFKELQAEIAARLKNGEVYAKHYAKCENGKTLEVIYLMPRDGGLARALEIESEWVEGTVTRSGTIEYCNPADARIEGFVQSNPNSVPTHVSLAAKPAEQAAQSQQSPQQTVQPDVRTMVTPQKEVQPTGFGDTVPENEPTAIGCGNTTSKPAETVTGFGDTMPKNEIAAIGYGNTAQIKNQTIEISKSDPKENNTKDHGRETGAYAPGIPRAEDGYYPPKNWDGEKVRNPNGKGAGWPDRNGDVWVPTGEGPLAHGGPHWDVQCPKTGRHKNILPDGKER